MKKTIALNEVLGDVIQRTRGELMRSWGKDIGFSRMLNFFGWQGLRRLSELDEDTLVKELKKLKTSMERADIEESIAEVEDRLREKIERGEIVISSKKSS